MTLIRWGGVVLLISETSVGSETCLPAREHGWAELRWKFASGVMKENLTSPRWKCVVIMGEEKQDFVADDDDPLFASLSANYPSDCGSPDSFECYLTSLDRGKDIVKAMDSCFFFAATISLWQLFSRGFLNSSPKFNSKLPTLSPSSSDYASLFTFSPLSTNWLDLSFVSS